MAHNETKIGSLLKNGRMQEAADAVVELLYVHKGNIVHAAIAVGVNRATLKRWVARLAEEGWDVRERLEQIREHSAPKLLTADELEAKRQQVQADREVKRALAWLEKASDEERAEVARDAKVRRSRVDEVADGILRSPTDTAKVLVVVKRRMAKQRRRWRERRRAKQH